MERGPTVHSSTRSTGMEVRIARSRRHGREAVQAIGERSVVYVPVAGDEGRFAERPVKLGPAVGESVQVVEGVKAGDRVVTTGSFFLRGEAARNRSGG